MEKSNTVKEVVYTPSGQDLPLQPKNPGKTCHFLYFTAATACLIIFAAGAALSWPSPVIPKLNNPSLLSDNPLGRVVTKEEESWIAALLTLGGILGPLAAGKSADRLGRKRTLLALAVPMLASFLITAFARSVPLYYFARTLMGLGVGAVFNVLPMYLSEIAEDHNRGLITCLMGVFCTSGLLFSYALGPFVSIKLFCLACALPIVVFLTVFGLFLPESPMFLAKTANKPGLVQCLRKLRSENVNQLEKEAEDMLKTAVLDQTQSKGGVCELFRAPNSRKGIFIVVSLLTFQQFAGINAVLSYMQLIFNAAHCTLSGEVSTIIVGTVQVLTTLVTSSVVDRLGRKLLLIVSAIGCALSLAVLGLYFHLQASGKDVEAISWLPIACLLFYIVAFNLGVGPLPWTIMAELFTANVRSVAATVASSLCFVSAFLITLLFPMLSQFLGLGMSFWFFGAVCVAMTVFLWLVVPETKGRTIQEIQSVLSGDSCKK